MPWPPSLSCHPKWPRQSSQVLLSLALCRQCKRALHENIGRHDILQNNIQHNGTQLDGVLCNTDCCAELLHLNLDMLIAIQLHVSFLTVIRSNVILLSFFLVRVIVQIVILINFIFSQCHFAHCHSVPCHPTQRFSAKSFC